MTIENRTTILAFLLHLAAEQSPRAAHSQSKCFKVPPNMFLFSKPLSDYLSPFSCCISSFSSLAESVGYFVFKSKHISVINRVPRRSSGCETAQSDQEIVALLVTNWDRNSVGSVKGRAWLFAHQAKPCVPCSHADKGK